MKICSFGLRATIGRTSGGSQEVYIQSKIQSGPHRIAVLKLDGTQKSGEGVGRHVQRAFIIIVLLIPFRPI